MGLLLSATVGVSHALPILSIDPVESKVNLDDVFTVDVLWHANAGGDLISLRDVHIMVKQSIIDNMLGESATDGFLDGSVWISTDEVGVAGQFRRSSQNLPNLKVLQDTVGKAAVAATFQSMALASRRSNTVMSFDALSYGRGQQLGVQARDEQACMGPGGADSGVCATVPAPGALWLIVLGLLGMVFSCRKK